MKNNNLNPRRPLYIFHHIPRTGGTTIRNHLGKNLSKEEIITVSRKYEQSLRTIKSLSKKERQEITVICGHHAHYGLHRFFPDRKTRYVTFVRDPVERTVSEYKHLLYQYLKKEKEGKEPVGKRPGDFPDWCKNCPLAHNHIAKTIITKTGRPLNFEAAKNLLENYYFIGFVESFREDAGFFFWLLGLLPDFENRNVSTDNYKSIGEEKPEPDLKKAKKMLEHHNRLDNKIYGYARKRNKIFKEENKEYRRFLKEIKNPKDTSIPQGFNLRKNTDNHCSLRNVLTFFREKTTTYFSRYWKAIQWKK